MRMFLGTIVLLLIAIAVGIALNLLVTAATSAAEASLQMGTAALGFFAAISGGFIARRGFVPIAIATYAIFWGLAIYHVHKFGLGQSYLDLIVSNAAPIALSIASVGIGAFIGQRLTRGGKANGAAA